MNSYDVLFILKFSQLANYYCAKTTHLSLDLSVTVVDI